MKLRNKISLIAVLLTGAAILLCSAFLIYYSASSNLTRTMENGRANQSVRSASWSGGLSRALSGSDSPEARRSMARYYAALYGDSGTVVVCGDDVIYDAMRLNPAEHLSLTGAPQQSAVVPVDNRKLLIVGQQFSIGESEYSFYEVSDITSVYTDIVQMVLWFGGIDLVSILLAGLLSVLILRRVLSPLEELKNSAAQIADGAYGERAPVRRPDEIGALARSFNQMAQAVERHVLELETEAERQTLLLGALTHELKTPITGIKGNAETLLMTQLTAEEQEEALLFIDSECTRVERLSQKLMGLISLRESGGLQLSPCPVFQLFAQVEASCAELIKRRGLRLEICNEMDTVAAEPDLLVSLLLNLIDNAGKASAPGGKILLSAKENCISVRDFGQGIPEDQLDKITQPFYMVDKSRSRKAGGAGLGLALAAEIAELHHARLRFESEVGNGTIVTLEFDPIS